jgi:hypothetical protein
MTPDAPTPRATTVLASLPYLGVALGLTLLVYRPLTGAYFIADDWLTLQRLANGELARLLIEPSGDHVYVARNLVWGVLWKLFGGDPQPYFVFVLGLHLLNVALLFLLLRRLCDGDRIACFGAAVWGTSPLAEGALGWLSCFGHAMVATLILVVLLDLARVVDGGRSVGVSHALWWSGLLVVASTCFGVGIGIALAFPVVVWLLLGDQTSPGARACILLLPAVIYAGYVGIHQWHAALYGSGAEASRAAAFARAHDWRNVLGMFRHLVAAGAGELVLGFAVPFDRYPTAPGVFVAAALLFATAAMVAYWMAPRAVRRWMLAVVVLTAAAYGIIAAGRGAIVSFVPAYGNTIRYHYVAAMLLSLILSLCVRELAGRSASWLGTPALGVALGGVVLSWAVSGWAMDLHDDVRYSTSQAITEIRLALAVAPPGKPVYYTNRPFSPGLIGFVGTAALYEMYFRDAAREVYFIEKNPDVRALAPPGTPLARLLVAPESVEAARAWFAPVPRRRPVH